MDLTGIFPPICTPFASNGSLALRELRKNIEKYNTTPLSGYTVTGSTGESVSLSKNEKLRVWDVVRKAAAPEKLLIAGTGAQSVSETIDLTNAAAERDYDVALVLTPYYYKQQMLRPESQLSFFRKVADLAKIPVLIYDFPQITGIDLPVDLIHKLSEHPNIIGIKESSTDLEKIRQLVAALPPHFPVLVGGSAIYHSCLALGAVGGVLGIANVVPHAIVSIHSLYKNRDIVGSRAAQEAIIHAAGVSPRYGIQGLKYAMDLKGYYGGPARLPLLPLSSQEKSAIEDMFRNIEDK
jgi:4-hydroxy-2-oxoglutarate aldolase